MTPQSRSILCCAGQQIYSVQRHTLTCAGRTTQCATDLKPVALPQRVYHLSSSGLTPDAWSCCSSTSSVNGCCNAKDAAHRGRAPRHSLTAAAGAVSLAPHRGTGRPADCCVPSRRTRAHAAPFGRLHCMTHLVRKVWGRLVSLKPAAAHQNTHYLLSEGANPRDFRVQALRSPNRTPGARHPQTLDSSSAGADPGPSGSS